MASQLLQRYYAVLKAVASSGGIGFAEIVRLTGMPKSTVHRLTAALQDEKFLSESEDGAFRIGPALREVFGRYLATENETGRYRRLLSNLANRFGETAFLAKFDGSVVSIVEAAAPTDAYRSHVFPGLGPRPLDVCSSSKAILAFREDALEGRLAGSLAEPELRAVREKGFAICDGDIEAGIYSVALPVIVLPVEPYLSIGLSGPASRFRSGQLEEIVPALKAAADSVGDCIIDEHANHLGEVLSRTRT
ncbi:MAG: helix-turn-helix domain-containing protein [Hoeflea sp. D1-CHI-28]